MIFAEFDRNLCTWDLIRDSTFSCGKFFAIEFHSLLGGYCWSVWSEHCWSERLTSLTSLRCYKNWVTLCQDENHQTIEALYSEMDDLHSVLNNEKVHKSRFQDSYIVLEKHLFSSKLEQDVEFQSNLLWFKRRNFKKTK